MKTKSIYFSNFNYQYSNKNENINDLSIESMSNINTSNGFIQSELSANIFLSELFNEDETNLILENNNKLGEYKCLTTD